MARAAIGFSAHLGWAAAVAIVGTRKKIEVIDRRKVVLVAPDVLESHEPWHKAAKSSGDPARAREIVRRGTRAIEACARKEIGRLIRDLEKQGHTVVGIGILHSGGPPKLEFESILAAHTLQHTAEGRLMRDALAVASEKRGVPVLAVKERELLASAASQLSLAENALVLRTDELGKGIGPPWAKDQKNAAMIAWMALR